MVPLRRNTIMNPARLDGRWLTPIRRSIARVSFEPVKEFAKVSKFSLWKKPVSDWLLG